MNHSHRKPHVMVILAVPVVTALVLTLFAWPSARMEPRDLPIGVAGAPAAAGAIEQRLTSQGGAFEVHRYPNESAARDAIEDREVYGAFCQARRSHGSVGVGRQPGGCAVARPCRRGGC